MRKPRSCQACRRHHAGHCSVNTRRIGPAATPTSPPQLAPVLPPAYVVDLLTADGMAAFGAQWKHMEVKIVEGPALPNAMPGYKTSYDITPHAA
jgi:hypothetical protein